MKLGFLCPDVSDSYQRNLLGAFSRKAVSVGHSVVVAGTNVLPADPGTLQPENRLLGLVGSGPFDGLVLMADAIFHHVPAAQARERMAALGDRPWVSIDKVTWHDRVVALDNTSALPALMDHLFVDHGYRDYLFLLGPTSANDARERADCFLGYLQDRSSEARWATLTCDFLEEKAYDRVVSFFRSSPPFRPRVIVASNDNMALGAIRALRTLGLSCPDDCAVTGFDDVEEAAFETPALTTVRQPLDVLAARAFEVLLDAPGERAPGPVVVPTRLVLRESCGCRPSRGAAKDYRFALSRVQTLRIRGETLLGASAAFGVQVNGALDLDALLSHLQDHCRALAVPHLRIALLGDEPVPPSGIPSRWREVYRFGPRGGERVDAWVALGDLLFPFRDYPDPGVVHSVSLLHAEGRVIGLLGCSLPAAWLGFLRLLASNLSGGLSRVGRWRTLLDHSEDLEESVALRNRDLTAANQALKLENDRRKALEAALTAERTALQDILEAQPTALVAVSAEGRRVRYFNRPFARLIGLVGQEPLPAPDELTEVYGTLLAGDGPDRPGEASVELDLPTLAGGTVPVLAGRTVLVLRGERTVLAGMMDLSRQKQLELDLLDISENDTRRFGQELHDDVCQKLAALSLSTALLDRRLEERTGGRVPEVAELSALTEGILDHVRSLSRGLFPVEVGVLPLARLLEQLLGQFGAQTGLALVWSSNLGDLPSGLPGASELHLFRLLQEALQNTLKHARAAGAEVRLNREGGRLILDYLDDGRGPGPGFAEGLGLRSMRYRASQMGAALSLGPGPRGGFFLRLVIPLG